MSNAHRRWRSSTLVVQRARQLRRELTPAERRLWQHLRYRQLDGHEFRRQHAMGRFIVDFYCPEAKLVIEVDGDAHADQPEYDAERSRWIEQQKHCRVIRFRNQDIDQNIPAVLDAIAALLRTPRR
ncbi:MAG: endonuclease domain-containing protein [Candidatus Binatia bacterium]